MKPNAAGPRNGRNSLATFDPGDAAATAMMIAARDAQKACEEARAARHAAQRDRVQLLRRAADKLRDMATKARGSGVLQGVLGLASTGLSLCGRLKQIDGSVAMKTARDPVQALAGARACKSAVMFETSGKTLDAFAKFDPLVVSRLQDEAAKRELEIAAERAAGRVQEANDRASEGSRLQTSMARQLQKLAEGAPPGQDGGDPGRLIVTRRIHRFAATVQAGGCFNIVETRRCIAASERRLARAARNARRHWGWGPAKTALFAGRGFGTNPR